MPEIRGNLEQCKSEHQGFKKAKERTWDSTSLRKESLRLMQMQFLDSAAIVCLQV
jgi:hypothetical protein